VTTTGQINRQAELAGMMRGEAGAFFGDPVLPLFETVIPTYLKLKGDRLYWSISSIENEDGTTRPTDHANRNKVSPGSSDPSQEIKSLRNALARNSLRGYDPNFTTKGMLDAFVRVREGNDVLRFAKRYGILELCEHSLPMANGSPSRCAAGYSCRPRGWPGLCWDPIDGWLRFVRQAKGMLGIAAALNQGKTPDGIHWTNADHRDLSEETTTFGKYLSSEDLNFQQHLLARSIGEWLRMGEVEPLFTWPESGPAIGFIGTTFGTLAAQLMFVVSKSQALAVCSGCGQPYLRRGKKPQRGRRNFCPSCGEKTASRLRKRDQRAKNLVVRKPLAKARTSSSQGDRN